MTAGAAKCAPRIAALAAALALVVLFGRAMPAQDSSPSDVDRAWVQKIFPVAFDQFFPVERAQGDFIAVRSHREFVNDVPEYSFVLEDTQDVRALHATIREAQGSSLYEQLLALHSKNPSESYEDVKPALKVREWKLSVADCPALATQLTAYQNVQFVRPRDDDDIAEHPILYEFHESVGGSDSEAVEFVESRAFPKWANATRKALDSCIASMPASAAKNQ